MFRESSRLKKERKDALVLVKSAYIKERAEERTARMTGRIGKSTSMSLSILRVGLLLYLLYTGGILFHVEGCIRQLWCSLIILYSITKIAYNHHTDN